MPANFLGHLRSWEMPVVIMSQFLWSGRVALSGANDVKDQSPKGQRALHKGKCAVQP